MGLEAVLPGPQNALYVMLCYYSTIELALVLEDEDEDDGHSLALVVLSSTVIYESRSWAVSV